LLLLLLTIIASLLLILIIWLAIICILTRGGGLSDAAVGAAHVVAHQFANHLLCEMSLRSVNEESYLLPFGGQESAFVMTQLE